MFLVDEQSVSTACGYVYSKESKEGFLRGLSVLRFMGELSFDEKFIPIVFDPPMAGGGQGLSGALVDTPSGHALEFFKPGMAVAG